VAREPERSLIDVAGRERAAAEMLEQSDLAMRVRQLQAALAALEAVALVQEADVTFSVVALGAGAAVNVDFADVSQDAKMMLVGAFVNLGGSQALRWTWGMFGTGIRVTVDNPTGGALSGDFRGSYVRRP
jgi:hypothetical protein